MKYWILISLFLSFNTNARSQITSCNAINYNSQENKNFLEIKQSNFCLPAFVIQDTCYFENRFIETAKEGVITYHPAYLLTKEEVLKVELYISGELKSKNMQISNKESKALLKNYYRQYIAYVNAQNEIEINIYFCTKKFLANHTSFKYRYLSPLIINSANNNIYSGKVIFSKDIGGYKNLIIRKLS
jgi:hypothetical protein